MDRRITLSGAAALALVLVATWDSAASAQPAPGAPGQPTAALPPPPPPGPGMPPPAGAQPPVQQPPSGTPPPGMQPPPQPPSGMGPPPQPPSGMGPSPGYGPSQYGPPQYGPPNAPPAPGSAWSAPGSGAPPEGSGIEGAPPGDKPAHADGVTEAGYPITQRGRLGIELTGFKLDTGSGFGFSNAVYAASTALSARARITQGFFADVRFATAGLVAPGNLMGGVDYMFKIQKTGWITAGLGLGVPLARSSGSSSALYYYGFLNAMWNAFEYAPNTVPLRLDFKFEQYIGGLGIRAELQPVVYFPVDVPNASPQLLFQHAVEVQYGHSIGGGLRLQGVANSFQQDGYQSAAELFVVMRRELGFARLGLLKTLDEDVGSPYGESWGMRFSGGIHLD